MDSVDVSSTPATTRRARNRLLELRKWLDQENLSGAEEEGASWWIVTLCVLCFIAVVVIVVWFSPSSSSNV